MKTGFEDAFTAVQADYISLCLELAGGDVDTVYGFMYQAPGMHTFNVFFGRSGQIQTLDDVAPKERIAQFFRVGQEDMKKLFEVCTRYDHPCPNQLKLVYDTKTGRFDADYVYMKPAELEAAAPAEILMDWMDAEEDRLMGIQ